jgi:hypothetical protein
MLRSRALKLGMLLLFAPLPLVAGEGVELRRLGRVEHPAINEMSGLSRSRGFEGVWWVHNDSGDRARIFPIDASGRSIVPSFLGESKRKSWSGIDIGLAVNLDWEDIAQHEGKLYIADLGNNGNARRDLGIYVLNEPNPRAVTKTRVLAHWPVRYPEQLRYPARRWHFDCEALFIDRGRPYVLTKHRVAGRIAGLESGTRLYRLDSFRTDAVNVLTLVCERDDLFAPTAADLSPSGQRLAVLTLTDLWLFDRPANGDRWLSGASRRETLPLLKIKQAEGVCFDAEDRIRISNEQGELYELRLDRGPAPRRRAR